MPKTEKKHIDLPDGSKLAADCWWQQDKTKHATIITLSGFEGYQSKKRSLFVRQMVYKAFYFGFNVIHLKQRGEGDTIHLTNSLFSADPASDITYALEKFNAWGLKQFYFAGISGGGWGALFSTAKLSSNAKKQISGIVSISAPINHLSTIDYVHNNFFYKRVLLYLYKNLVKRRIKIDPKGTWDKKILKKIKSVREWDEVYLNTFKKFSNVDDYHRVTDLTSLLAKSSIPTLIINAKDDPIIPVSPYMGLKNPFIITIFPEYGGHGGFFTTKKLYGDLDGHWAQNRAMEFIKLLENNK